jgi:hypothetical protein
MNDAERDDEPSTTDLEDDRTMTETAADHETDERGRSTATRVRRGVDYLLLAGLAVFALVAAVGLYTSMQGVIRTWIEPDFRPVVNAAFNLVVLLVVGAGLVRQVRRLG